MRSVLVVGGAGFIGSNLVRKLLDEGERVVVLDDFSSGLLSNLEGLKCEIVNVSILEFESICEYFSESKYVFHLAARGSVPRSISNPQATFNVNTIGAFNVFEAARKYGIPTLFSSSSSVYGKNDALPKKESMWTCPLTPYAASKLAGEALASSYYASYGIPIASFRFFNVYGPQQRPEHQYAAVIPKWIWSAMQGNPIYIHGDGMQTRDFTYVDDVVNVLIESFKRELGSISPINLAFGNRISLLEVINEIREFFPNIEVEFGPVRKGDVRDSQNEPTVLKSLFPKVNTTAFRDGLLHTIEWLRENEHTIMNSSIKLD